MKNKYNNSYKMKKTKIILLKNKNKNCYKKIKLYMNFKKLYILKKKNN